jgi:hypothetical protein
MERVAAAGFGAGHDMGSGFALEHHEPAVIPLFIIVGQVEVPISEQTVADEEVMRLVSAEGDTARHQEKRPGVKGQERPQEEGGHLSSEGEGGELSAPGPPEQTLVLTPAPDLNGLEIDDGGDDTEEEKFQPGLEVGGADVVAEGQE